MQAVSKNTTPQEVETELRGQIERAKKFGIDPTHFDAHMFCGDLIPGLFRCF